MSEQMGASAPIVDSQVESNEVAENSVEGMSNEGAIDASEAADNAEEVLNDPKASKTAKAEAKKTLKQLKIKYNGREYTETLPFEIPDDDAAKEYMTQQLQMSKLAQQKGSEHAQLQKEVEEFVKLLKENPRKVLEDPNLGLDMKKLVAQYIEEEIANSGKSEEQLAAERAQAELKALKEENKKREEEYKQKEFARLQQQEFERYDMLMTQALEKSDLPKSPYIVKKMADYISIGLQEGIDVSPADVLPLVREEMLNELKEMFSIMPEEVIENIVGKENINKIRKKNLGKAKNAPPAPLKSSIKDTGITKPKAGTEVEKTANYKDFFKF